MNRTFGATFSQTLAQNKLLLVIHLHRMRNMQTYKKAKFCKRTKTGYENMKKKTKTIYETIQKPYKNNNAKMWNTI